MLTSWSSLMFSRALLTMTFANAFVCRVSVTLASTCEHVSSDLCLVNGFFCLTFSKTCACWHRSHPWCFRVLCSKWRSRTHLSVGVKLHQRQPANKQAVIDGSWAGFSAWHFRKMFMLTTWSSLIFSHALLTMTFASAFLWRASAAWALTCEKLSSDWWLVRGFLSALHFQKMFILTSSSYFMFSRALLTMTFANASSCGVSVASASTCAQISCDWWMLSGFLLGIFKKCSCWHRGHPWCGRARCSQSRSRTKFYIGFPSHDFQSVNN